MSENKIQIVRSLLKQSVGLLYENDCYLITNSVHEQSISHRIAYYLENLLRNYDWFVKDGYSVDVEYNRNLDEHKSVHRKCDGCKKLECYLKTSDYGIEDYESICRPDIIVHKRGCDNISQDDFNNLIVIEIKKGKEKDNFDFSKLKSFTCKYSTYKYNLGIYINITNPQSQSPFTYFQNGKEVNKNDIDWKEFTIGDKASVKCGKWIVK